MIEESETSELLDFNEAMAILGVSRPTLYRWLHQHRVRAYKVGKQWRFQREDLDAVLQESSADSDRDRSDLEALAKSLDVPLASGDLGRAASEALIAAAVDRGATDIHLDPTEDGGCRVRLREEGLLSTAGLLGPGAARALREALALWAGGPSSARSWLGRITLSMDDRRVEVRVNQLPTVLGDQLTLKVLDRKRVSVGLDRIFQSPADRALADRLMGTAYGLVLVSGPTGSGKTTTAYAMLQALAARDLAVYSLEEPVEMLLTGDGEAGVTQVQVEPDEGLSYPAALRRVMHGDPDVVFLADVPDRETARAACKAATTGHLVLVQLEASSAADAVDVFTREAGDARLVGSCFAGVINQRLLRRVCPDCHGAVKVSAAALAKVGLVAEEDVAAAQAVGCERCVGGYRGRLPIYEFLLPDDAVLDRVSQGDIAALATSPSLRDAALERLKGGEITVEEVRRVLILPADG